MPSTPVTRREAKRLQQQELQQQKEQEEEEQESRSSRQRRRRRSTSDDGATGASGSNSVPSTPDDSKSKIPQRQAKSTTAKQQQQQRSKKKMEVVPIMQDLMNIDIVNEDNTNNNDNTNEETTAAAATTPPTTKTPPKKKSKSQPNNSSDKDNKDEKTEQPKPKHETSSKKKHKRNRSESPSSPSSSTTKKTATNVASSKVNEDADMSSSTSLPTLSPPPVLDVEMHRLRHLDYIPSPVLAMTSTTSNDGNLALARQDGSYELYNVVIPDHNPTEQGDDQQQQNHNNQAQIYPLTKIAGSNLLVAHSLCWVPTTSTSTRNSTLQHQHQQHQQNDDVCVAAGPNGTLWIVNFEKSQLQCRISSGGGGIFDLTTCQHYNNTNSSTKIKIPIVATACQDGAIRFFRVESSSSSSVRKMIESTPIATIPTVGAGTAVVSLTWGIVKQLSSSSSSSSSSASTVHSYETVLFAGVADGTIRKYELILTCTTTNGTTSMNDNDNTSSSLSSSILWSITKQTSILRMTMESRGRKSATKVWTMQMLMNNNNNSMDITLVTGNSLGQVQFWNAQTGTLQQTVSQTEYKADVLKIVINADQTKVFASGVDSRVICLERESDEYNTNNNTNVPEGSLWKWNTAQRPHTHDVKAMAIVNTTSTTSGANNNNKKTKKNTTNNHEILVTSGIDTKLCSYIVSDFAKRRPQIWYPWPMKSPISTATTTMKNDSTEKKTKIHIVSMQRPDGVDLFQLDNDDHSISKSSSFPIGKIRIQTQSNLVTSQLSPNGQWLAFCNATALFVFALNFQKRSNDNDDDDSLLMMKPTKIHLPKSMAGQLCVTVIAFHDDDLYVADTNSNIYILNLETTASATDMEDVSPTILKISSSLSPSTSISPTKKTKSSSTSSSTFSLPIDSIQISKNGLFLAAFQRNRHDAIHIFKRSTVHTSSSSSPTFVPYWTIPSLAGSRPVAMTLINHGNSTSSSSSSNSNNHVELAVATPDSHVYIFDLTKQALSSWSEQNGFPIRGATKSKIANNNNDDNNNNINPTWPSDLTFRKDFPVRLTSNPNNPNQLIMASFGAFWVFNLNEQVPAHCRIVPEVHVRRKRQKRDNNNNHNKHGNNNENDDDGSIIPLLQAEEYNDITISKMERQRRKYRKEDPTARNCTMCLYYNSMLYLDFLNDNNENGNGKHEMVVVEQPWLRVISTFPEPLQRRVYGGH